jgi:NAD(P)-dependent dehydrogenase (short-subunit alcohol dehydrogenase family)
MPSTLRESDLPARPLPRLLGASFRQAARTPRCPDSPRLDGRLAVVTGATGGIGREIARGLARRGASLVLPCRSPAKGERVAGLLRPELAPGASLALVAMDLEDLASVRRGAEEILRCAAGRSVDVLVENAGVWPLRYAETRQGFEIAFGVNVLAHHALRRALLAAGALAAARVVVLTGDIYVLASECTPDRRWSGALGGMLAYCRSKLGNHWIASELARRVPALEVAVVHPGVVATGLAGELGAFAGWLRRRILLTPEQGAQMPLFCATQPDLASGGYWHNVHGRVRLAPADPARDAAAAARLWETCEALAAR